MSKYNHAFDLAFIVSGSTTDDGSEITAEQFRDAILKRVQDLYDARELIEAVGAPFDSYEED